MKSIRNRMWSAKWSEVWSQPPKKMCRWLTALSRTNLTLGLFSVLQRKWLRSSIERVRRTKLLWESPEIRSLELKVLLGTRLGRVWQPSSFKLQVQTNQVGRFAPAPGPGSKRLMVARTQVPSQSTRESLSSRHRLKPLKQPPAKRKSPKLNKWCSQLSRSTITLSKTRQLFNSHLTKFKWHLVKSSSRRPRPRSASSFNPRFREGLTVGRIRTRVMATTFMWNCRDRTMLMVIRRLNQTASHRMRIIKMMTSSTTTR